MLLVTAAMAVPSETARGSVSSAGARDVSRGFGMTLAPDPAEGTGIPKSPKRGVGAASRGGGAEGPWVERNRLAQPQVVFSCQANEQ